MIRSDFPQLDTIKTAISIQKTTKIAVAEKKKVKEKDKPDAAATIINDNNNHIIVSTNGKNNSSIGVEAVNDVKVRVDVDG